MIVAYVTSTSRRLARAARRVLLLTLAVGTAGLPSPAAGQGPAAIVPPNVSAELPAPPPAAAPGAPTTILLLRNGRTLEGRIARAGDYYYVAVAGGQVRIGADQVELWCADLEDGYRRKRAAIHPGIVEDHLRLAHWCLRQRLFDHAAAELADARRAEPMHPMIALLARQLAAAQNPPAPQPPLSLSAAAARPKPQGGPTPEELDAMVEQLPREAVETFARTIQPLLINTCGSAACHGPGAHSEFRLRRIPSDRPPTRLTTQHNLHAALKWVDRSHPASSALLTGPAEPHGPANAPVFSKFQTAQYQRLVDWVHQVTGVQTPDAASQVVAAQQPANAAAANGDAATSGIAGPPEAVATAAVVPTIPKLLDQPPGARPLAVPQAPGADDPSAPPDQALPGRAVPAGYEKPLSEPAPDDAEPLPSGDDPPRGPIRRGAKIEGFVPKDPFDPEIFNRRYFPSAR